MSDVAASPPSTIRGSGTFLVALCATSFLATLMYASLSPFFSEIGSDLDVSVPALGQVITLRLLLSAGLAIIAGPIADRFGYRRTIMVGLVALCLTFLGVALSQSFAMLLLTSLPGGLAGATLSGIPLAFAATSFSGNARRQAISYVVAALSSSAIIGVPVLTTISTIAGWRGSFLFATFLSLISIPLIWRALPTDPVVDRSQPITRATILGPYSVLLGEPRMIRLYGSTFLRATGWIGYLTYVGAYLADDVGFSITTIGLVFMVSGIAYFGGSILAGRYRSHWSPASIASIMTLFAAAMLILLSFAHNLPALVVIGIFGISLGSSLAWVMFTTLMSTATTAGQGTTMSFNATIQNLGAATGGIIGGVLIAISGYQLMGAGLALALVASAVLIMVSARSFDSAPVTLATTDS